MTDRRIHGLDAAGAGEIDGDIVEGPAIGPCPSCAAELRGGTARNPATQQIEHVILHTVPFCTYFGETSPEEILRTIEERRS